MNTTSQAYAASGISFQTSTSGNSLGSQPTPFPQSINTTIISQTTSLRNTTILQNTSTALSFSILTNSMNTSINPTTLTSQLLQTASNSVFSMKMNNSTISNLNSTLISNFASTFTPNNTTNNSTKFVSVLVTKVTLTNLATLKLTPGRLLRDGVGIVNGINVTSIENSVNHYFSRIFINIVSFFF